ncbi:hypothetical protein MHYP_G00291300 [Metynnis hypsauchen]
MEKAEERGKEGKNIACSEEQSKNDKDKESKRAREVLDEYESHGPLVHYFLLTQTGHKHCRGIVWKYLYLKVSAKVCKTPFSANLVDVIISLEADGGGALTSLFNVCPLGGIRWDITLHHRKPMERLDYVHSHSQGRDFPKREASYAF